MISQELLDALNSALAMDLRALTQYMWQHVMAVGGTPNISEVGL
jgi:bacterioferritin (cytochrome b1)